MTLDEKLAQRRKLVEWWLSPDKAITQVPDSTIKPTQETPKTMGQIDSWMNNHISAPVVSPERQALLDKKAQLDAWNLSNTMANQDKATNITINQRREKPASQLAPVEQVKADAEQFNLDQAKQQAEQEKQTAIEQKKQNEALTKDSNFLYGQLQSWATIDKSLQNTPAYKQANTRFTAFNQFNSMTASQLSNAIQWWTLVPWTDVYNDLMKTSPDKIRTAENTATMTELLSKDSKPTTFQEAISKYILNNFVWDAQDFKWALSSNPEVIKLNNSVTEKKKEVDALKDQIDNAENDILKELKWTWATTAYKNALIANRLKWLYRKYELKSQDYNTSVWQLQQTTENIKYEYEQSKANQQKALEWLQALYWISTQERAYKDKQAQALKDNQFKQQQLKAKYWQPSTWAWSTLDFSNNQNLITKYMWEASFKNNNPTWITFWAMSPELKQMFDEAWIKYSKWTNKPASEWWNYVKFATVNDWLNAYRIALTQRWDDVYSRLKSWVWTADWDNYATNLMNEAWIKKWAKFSELSENQIQKLMTAQLKKESPNFYNEIMARENPKVEVTDSDLARFNNNTFKPDSLKTPEDKAKYAEYQKQLEKTFWAIDANFYDVISKSRWWSKGSSWERDTLNKYSQALWWLSNLTKSLWSQETWPIIWRLKELNPYSTWVAEFKSIIAWLVPTVARWVFNEVWVLTDNDVERYLWTLPTLTKTADQNKLVIEALLKTLSTWMKSQLDTMARTWLDVSKFSWAMKKVDADISKLRGATEKSPKQAFWNYSWKIELPQSFSQSNLPTWPWQTIWWNNDTVNPEFDKYYQ